MPISSGQNANITDGTDAGIKASILDYTNSNPLAVRLTDTNGDYIAAGAGTQYTEGDIDATITGTATMMEVAGNTLQPIQGTVADGLLVNLGTNNDVVVSATDLDIRNLTATDVVTVTGGAGQTADVKITLDSESVAVTGTFWQATQPISAASLPLPTGAATSALQGGGLPAALGAGGGLKVDGSGTALPVSLASVPSHDVTNVGTFAVQGTAVGTVADDGTTPSAPVMTGGKAVETDGTDPTSVSAEDDVAIFRTDRNRRLLVNDNHPNFWTLYEDHTTAQTNNQLKAAPGANLSLYVTDLIVSNGATAGTIKLVEDEGGTPVQKTQTIYMAINGGAVINFKTPLKLTANKTLGFTSATVTTHSIEVHGYIAP